MGASSSTWPASIQASGKSSPRSCSRFSAASAAAPPRMIASMLPRSAASLARRPAAARSSTRPARHRPVSIRTAYTPLVSIIARPTVQPWRRIIAHARAGLASELGFAPARVQHPLGVAVGLLAALEHQLAGGLKGQAAAELGGHRPIARLPGILLVHHARHALQGGEPLFARAHPMVQPVRRVLARDAQCGAIFHESDMLRIGYLGTTDTQVHPADHVAEDPL